MECIALTTIPRLEKAGKKQMMKAPICHYAKVTKSVKAFKQEWHSFIHCFLKTGSYYVNQASLELAEISLLLSTL